MSKARASEKRDYNRACRDQDKQMLDEYGYLFCVSCGCNHPDGGHSHNLSVKHFPDLEADPENFKLRCMKCHRMLDDTRDFAVISLFKDFEQLMEYRRVNSVSAYNSWVGALLAIGVTDYHYITR